MADQFTTTSTTSFGSRIISAIIGIPVGLALIVISIGVLYWNEGRFDSSKLAKTAISVNASAVDQTANGKFVSVSGPIASSQTIGDSPYLVAGTYIALHRTVEEYSWQETSHTSSHDNTGGSSTNTTTYTYAEAWQDNPPSGAAFHEPTGHTNPPQTIADDSQRVTTATVGAYNLDATTVKLPALQPLGLSAPIVTPPTGVTLANSQYLYMGSGSLATPSLGDQRISYQALPTQTAVTVFGKLDNGSLGQYTDAKNHSMYQVFVGNRDAAISQLHTSYVHTKWLFRGGGIVALWIGLSMLVAPISVLFSFLPFLGSISRAILGLVTIPLALLIGGSVIIISAILHNPVALVLTVLIVGGIGFALIERHGKKRSVTSGPTPPTPAAPTSPTPPAPPQQPPVPPSY